MVPCYFTDIEPIEMLYIQLAILQIVMDLAYLMNGYEECKNGERPTNALSCSSLQKDERLMYKGPIVCRAVGGGWYKWCGAAQI